MKWYRAVICVWYLLPLHAQDAFSWRELDFDDAMRIHAYQDAVERTRRVIGIDGNELLRHFQDLYSRFNVACQAPLQQLKIPKIIHHIWLGSPLPNELRAYVDSWKKIHGDTWQYNLWTDDDIAQLDLYNQEFYNATDNYGAKSDIARLEILYRYGGVYVDTDFECLERLDYLHYVCDLYTGLQPLDTLFVQLGSALIGCIPGHPLIKYCIETVKYDWHRKGAPQKTGPIHFTKSFRMMAGKNGRVDVALPALYFYPLNATDRISNDRNAWRALGGLAVHHWSKTWMPVQWRPAQFRTIDNNESTLHWND